MQRGMVFPTMVFLGIPLAQLRGLPDGALSSSVMTTLDGTRYAAAFDFRGDALKELRLVVCDHFPDLASLFDGIGLGSEIDLPRPLSCTLVAQIGRMQTTEDESFVPLIVTQAMIEKA